MDPMEQYQLQNGIDEAGLDLGIIDETTTFNCPGYHRVGRDIRYCWRRGGHGDVNVVEAITRKLIRRHPHVFGDGAGLPLLLGPVQLRRCLAMVAAGVGFEHAGVDREALTLDEAHGHRRPNDPLEDVAQYAALAEAAQAVEREGRVMRDLVFEIELTKPAIREVQLDFLAEPALRADAAAVADNKHSDHELRIDRRTSDLAVVGLQFLVQIGQCRCHKHVDPSQQVVRRDTVIEMELVEQLALVPSAPPHHRPVLRRQSSQQTESPFGVTLNAFIDSIDPNRT